MGNTLHHHRHRFNRGQDNIRRRVRRSRSGNTGPSSKSVPVGLVGERGLDRGRRLGRRFGRTRFRLLRLRWEILHQGIRRVEFSRRRK
jgi:hypothetical protein